MRKRETRYEGRCSVCKKKFSFITPKNLENKLKGHELGCPYCQKGKIRSFRKIIKRE